MMLLREIYLYCIAEVLFCLAAGQEQEQEQELEQDDYPIPITYNTNIYQTDTNNQNDTKLYCPGPNAPMNFTDFDNSMGMENGCYIVPNYVHFLKFKGDPIFYLEMICILSAFQIQKPEKLYIHYEKATTFTGKYWRILEEYPGFMDVAVFVQTDIPHEIYGQDLTQGSNDGVNHWVFHASDVTRIRVLMKYGGIYLDNDMYLVKPIHGFRRYEMTVGWHNESNLYGTQLLVAHKDARFLALWLESYKGNYEANEWYYNAAERPTEVVINKIPNIVHIVPFSFGNAYLAEEIYLKDWPDWNKYYFSIHILSRTPYEKIDPEYTDTDMTVGKFYNETNIIEIDTTLRKMCLSVYNPTNFTMI